MTRASAGNSAGNLLRRTSSRVTCSSGASAYSVRFARTSEWKSHTLRTKGTLLDGVRRFNQGALPGAANAAYIRPYPNFSLFTVADSFGDSNYHSLQARVTQRYSSGLAF